MARYYGRIGFGISEEEPKDSGVYITKITERNYRGTILKNHERFTNSENKLNKDFNISNTISILSDIYAEENAYFIRYAEWLNMLWEVLSVDVNHPRLTLYLGGVYNGEVPETGATQDITEDNP